MRGLQFAHQVKAGLEGGLAGLPAGRADLIAVLGHKLGGFKLAQQFFGIAADAEVMHFVSLDDAFGIESGTVTTIQASMNDQQVIDAYHPDLRRTRAASQSIIPVDTKLAAGITRIFPKFCDRFEAISVRVPTINVTAIDLSVTVTNPVSVLDVNNVLQRAAKDSFRSIVDYTELPLVSIDFNHDPHSAIVDGTQTRVSGKHLIKTLVWCDNEWGFANRMLDTTLAMMRS